MLDAIKNRRSVRFYNSDEVTGEMIKEVLEAGFCAPSAHAGRPWHAVVVRDQATKDKLATIHKYSRILSRVPVIIVVCVDKGDFDHFWVEDGSSFMSNILIQATSMGLGTCWIGVKGIILDGKDSEAIIREACGIPENFGILGVTPLGFAARYPGAHEPKLLDGRVHFESFGNIEK